MRILLITEDFPNPLQPTRGTFNLEMARALAQANEVVVVAYVSWRDEWRLKAGGRSLERMRSQDGVEVHHPRFVYPPGVLRSSYAWFLRQSVAGTVRRVLERFAPDVVMSYWLHPDGAVALRVAAGAGVPAVVMSGGSDLLVLTESRSRKACIVDVLKRADAAVCVSEHLAREAAGLAGPGTPVHVVRRGVDRGRFRAGDRAEARARLGWDPQRRTLLWVGRMVPVKGLDVLIDACARLPRHLDFALYLAGDGPLRGELASRARQAGLADRVVFAGTVPHGELADWYRAADVTVLPSRSEGVPNVLLESIACGTPFVASGVGGVPEIADLRADRLVPAGDARALAEAIADSLRQDRPLLRRFMPGSWEDSAAALERVFRSAIAARGSEVR
jgi:glycosyltransferase involved in cell wall biosynthesis